MYRLYLWLLGTELFFYDNFPQVYRLPGLGAAGLQVMIFPLISYNNFKQDMYFVNQIRKIEVYILNLLGLADDVTY